MFRQLTKGEVKEIADIMLREVFARADTKGIKIDVTERFKVRRLIAYPLQGCAAQRTISAHLCMCAADCCSVSPCGCTSVAS